MNLTLRGALLLPLVALFLACLTPQPPMPAAQPPQQPPPPPHPQTQIPSGRPGGDLKEPPNQPEYPCPQEGSESDDSSKASKGSNGPASRKREGEKDAVQGRLAPEIIQTIIRGRYPNFQSCYEQGLRRDRYLIGRVMMRFVIGRDGTITSIQPVCTSLPDREVVRCIAEQYKPLTFPQPEGGIVTVIYPIMFTPGD